MDSVLWLFRYGYCDNEVLHRLQSLKLNFLIYNHLRDDHFTDKHEINYCLKCTCNGFKD